MIKIEFSGLTFFPATGFKNVTTLLNRIIPIDDLVTNSSVEWNGKTSIVQSIFYDAFSLSFICKETEKQDFIKIAYAPKIEVIDTEISKTIQAKFIDVTFEKINDNQEFYICKFNFADYSTKNVQNNYKVNELFSLIFAIHKHTNPYIYYTDFESILKYNFNQNIKNDFKDKISDYNKRSEIYRFLIILETSELAGFFETLSIVNIKPGDMRNNKISIKEGTTEISRDIGQFSVINNNSIGENLYKIELELIKENTIVSSYN